jgi:endonuclease/exonuclease/phosphatase family metal-dependent hydrolase
MLFATWNMRRDARNWAAVTMSGYDVVLLQEACEPPGKLDGHVAFEILDPPRGRGRWGTAIWSRWPLTALRGSWSHPGAAAVAEVETPTGPLTAYSLYALFEYVTYASNGRRESYAVTTLHRLLSDLTVHLEDPARRPRHVLGGDFNCNPKWDLKSKHPTNRALIDRVEAYGLRSVLTIDEHVQIPTFKKSQIDYLFLGRAFGEVAGQVDVDGRLAGLSDHYPVTASVE